MTFNCPLIVGVQELLPRRSPVLIQRAIGSAVPSLRYRFGSGCCLATATVIAYFLGL